jgi:thiosulfate dehydrogenase (quinone) large subunit
MALQGFLQFATSATMTTGPHPSVVGPYVWLTDHLFLPHAAFLSYLVTMGELMVGLGLILGIFTRVASLGGTLLNVNYMLAGSAGLNAPMLPIELSIVLVGTTAGLIGLDAVILPYLRVRLLREKHQRIFQSAQDVAPLVTS